MKKKKVDKNLVPASKLQQTLLFFLFIVSGFHNKKKNGAILFKTW